MIRPTKLYSTVFCPGCGVLVHAKVLSPTRISCTFESLNTFDQMPPMFVAFLVCTEAFDGWPPAPSTNGFSQSHRDPRTVKRSFGVIWCSKGARLPCWLLLWDRVRRWPGSVAGAVKSVAGSRSYSYDAK